jgi:hypothetical protein
MEKNNVRNGGPLNNACSPCRAEIRLQPTRFFRVEPFHSGVFPIPVEARRDRSGGTETTM